ncbi:noggin-like [Schistocerca americana]|uniref:noggin-like n=1 Tax=Schistocerca americana TaxID=7009 RepID=UPI001F502B43|nr:noggin-like [Schistocerca americana]
MSCEARVRSRTYNCPHVRATSSGLVYEAIRRSAAPARRCLVCPPAPAGHPVASRAARRRHNSRAASGKTSDAPAITECCLRLLTACKMELLWTWCLWLVLATAAADAHLHAHARAHPHDRRLEAEAYGYDHNRTGLSPEDAGLKPSPPGDEYPLPEEPRDASLDPRPQDLNETALRARLGVHFDPSCMSITPVAPDGRGHHGGGGRAHPGGKTKGRAHGRHHGEAAAPGEFPFRRNKHGRLVPVGEMPEALHKLNLRYFKLPNGTRVRTNYPAKFRKKLQHFLWAFTACPVEHEWRDLGVRYWPRFLRLGHCAAGAASCSIPPGMHCRPDAKIEKKLLSWRCLGRPPSDRHCQWMDFSMFIVESCTCACPKNDSTHD